MSILRERVERIKKINEEFNIEIEVPISNDKVDPFKNKFLKEFGIEADNSLIEFLKICNGLTENGYTIYSSEDNNVDGVEYGIFENNKIWRDSDILKDYIFFAHGDIDLFAYDIKNDKYVLLDLGSGDKFEEFESMEKMLEYILERMIGEED